MESFEQVAAQYERMIHKIMNKLNIYKNRDEFFQLGLISLWEAWQQYDSEKGMFIHYAFAFVKGRMQREMTEQVFYKEKNVYPKEEFWDLIEDSRGGQPVTIEKLLSICGNLTSNQKKWLIYTCKYEWTIQEIAEKEQVSLSAVKAWRKGAREKLKAYRDGRLEDFLR